MTNYLLRVEAVNLNNFVYDTNRIQPMRGGGYLLLESVADLAKYVPKLKKITTGASIGLFSFSANKPEDIAKDVLTALNKECNGHATFVVDWAPITNATDISKDIELVTAKNRWRQYQQLTLVLPEKTASDAKDVCPVDGVRPISKGKFQGEEASASVCFRAGEGAQLRQSIYGRILPKESIPDKFTDDLDSLSEDRGKKNLNGKVAFIYVDGNKFGTIRTEKCSTGDNLTAFSNAVEKPRQEFLRKLLGKAETEADFKTAKGGIRLETLLWGGDEMEIIVPAWKGWEVLKLLYKNLGAATYGGIDLTHGGGIVFCNHKAPIIQVRKMAHALADEVKRAIRDEVKEINHISHAHHNAFHVLALESFDAIGPDVTAFADSWYGKGKFGSLRIAAGEMENIDKLIGSMKTGGFPRNKLFDIVHAVKAGNDPKESRDRALRGLDTADKIKEEIDVFLAGKNERWFLIAELWDYVGGQS